MNNTKLHFLRKAKSKTLKERVEEMYNVYNKVSTLLGKNDWLHLDNSSFMIENKSEFIAKVFKKFVNRIKKITTITNVSDDFVDQASSNYTIYGSKDYDNDIRIMQIIADNELELLIYNYDTISILKDDNSRQEFLDVLFKETGLKIIEE